MGGVGALQARLARRRNGAEIAADIGGRQAEPAQARDHDMGEILTDAVALVEGLAERRRDHRRLRVVEEIRCGCDASDRPRRRGCRAPGAKALARIGGDRRQHRHQRARIEIATGEDGPRLVACEGRCRGRSPRRAGGIGRRRAGATPSRASAASMRRLRCAVSMTTLSVRVPKKSRRDAALGGARADLDRDARSAPDRGRSAAPAAACSGRS